MRSPAFIEDTPDAADAFHQLTASENQVVYGVLTVEFEPHVDTDRVARNIDGATASYINA
jgi:hypothetical protein